MNSEIMKNIEYHIEKGMLMRVKRKSENGEYMGFPIKMTDCWLLMINVDDFHDEGYLLLQTEDILDAYSKESDSFYEKICIAEGLREKVKSCPIALSDDISHMLKQLKEKDVCVELYCKDSEQEGGFFLGKICDISKKSIEVLAIEPDGTWEKDTENILPDSILMVAFGDRYSALYYKYSK